MYIAYLAQQSGIKVDDKGGGAIHVTAIIRNLQRAGHRVKFISFGPTIRQVLVTEDLRRSEEVETRLTSSTAFKLVESGVRRVQKGLNLPYLAFFENLRYTEACITALRECQIFHERFSLLGVSGVLASRKLGVPLVLEVNADLLDEEDRLGRAPRGLQRWVMRWATKFSFNHAARIVAVSNPLKARLYQKWNVPEQKIVVLPNGADVEDFDPAADPCETRARLGLVEAPSVIFVGSFYPWHAPLDLVESFAAVARQVPEARLYLVGKGPMLPETLELARQLGLNGSVISVGAVPHAEIPDWLSAADVAVAPYPKLEQEIWFSPLKLYEYMAAGKAIVASKAGQVAEVIQDGYNGVLVEPGDQVGLARATSDLLKAPHERKRLGENARRQAVERHSWGQYIQRLEEIYSSLVR